MTVVSEPSGALAGLLSAQLIAPGELLYRTRAVRSAEPIAAVLASGRLRGNNGVAYSGPREAITAVEAERYGPIAWQCFTTSLGACLESLRQRAEPEQAGAASSHGALFPLLRAGVLPPGAELRFEMSAGRGRTGQRVRIVAVATAQVTADGLLRLADGSLYACPSPAAAACSGTLTNGWKAWHLTSDGRSLLVLRRAAGVIASPRANR